MKCFRHRAFHFIPYVLGGLALAVFMAFLFGALVMVLWNRLVPEIFGLKEISYWQAWGLLLLSHILLKPGHFHGGHGPWRSRYHDEEWRNRLRERFRRGPADGLGEKETERETGE